MLAAGLLLLATQGPAGALASEARAALIEANNRMQVAEACAAGRAMEARRARFDRLREEASGLLPSSVDPLPGDILGPIRCRRGSMRQATAALDRLGAAMARRRAAMHGLWFGPLHLCAGTVLAVEDGKDEQDRDRILIRFSPAMREALAVETTQRVRTQLPILLDGRKLAAPMVMEPILGGEISIAGGDPIDGLEGGAAAVRALAARPCED